MKQKILVKKKGKDIGVFDSVLQVWNKIQRDHCEDTIHKYLKLGTQTKKGYVFTKVG